MPVRLNSFTSKLVASAAIVGSAAAIAGLGTFGTFTSTTSASTAVSSGTVSIGLGTANTSANRLAVAASGLVPGDTVQRAVDLTNTGSSNLASVTLTTTAATSSLLDTTASALGLQVAVDRCSTAWVETAVGSGYTYVCGGVTTALLAAVPVIQTNDTLAVVNSLTAGGTDHLRITLSLPVAALNALQGQSSSINFAFTGTQRVATTL